MLSPETYVSFKGRKMPYFQKSFIRNGYQKILMLFVFILAMYQNADVLIHFDGGAQLKFLLKCY